MKNKKVFIAVLLISLIGSYAFAGGVKELILQDNWKVKRIETDKVIRKNLKEWVEISFNSKNKTVKVSTGSAWPKLLKGIDDVFTYQFADDNKILYLQKRGKTIHTIRVQFSANLKEMIWTGWKILGIPIVGPKAPIKQIVFTRK